MRYINPRFTYLLTVLQCTKRHAHHWRMAVYQFHVSGNGALIDGDVLSVSLFVANIDIELPFHSNVLA